GIFVKKSGQDPKRILLGARAAADSAPNDWQNVALYGAALYRAGQHKSALAELERALELLDKASPPAWLSAFLSLTHHQLGNQGEAAKWRERATRPEN